MIKKTLLVLLSGFIINTSAQALLINDHAVNPGDSKYTVLSKCGQPIDRQVIGTAQNLGGTVLIEQIVYYYAGGMNAVVTCEGDRVVNVEIIK